MTESQKPSPVHILLGVVVLCVILQILGIYDFKSLMGDDTKDKVVSPQLNTPNVKYIELIKDNSPSSINKNSGDSSSFAIAELKAYDENNILIGRNQYSSAVFTPENSLTIEYPGMNALDNGENTIAHSADGISSKLLFTLNNLKFIKKVVVENRKDYESTFDRIRGVKLNLYNANMKLINSCTLTGNPNTVCTWP